MRRGLFGTGRIAIGLIASGALLWLATRGVEWGLVAENLVGVSMTLLALSVVVFMFASYLRAVRWRLLFTTDQISSSRLFIIQNEGIGLNNVLPLRVASEVTQLAILTLRDGIRGATALATLGMERVIDVVASTMILAGAFFLVPQLRDFTPYVLGAIGFAVFLIVLVRLLAWGSYALGFVKRIAFLAAFTAAIREVERARLRIAASLLISAVYWMLVGVTSWIVAVALDLPISPIIATLVIMGTIFFATTVPGAPSAVGTFEFAVVYVLAFFGIERTVGFGYAVVIHAVFFLPPTIIAAFFLPREGVISLGRGRRSAAAREGPGPAA